MQMECAIQLRLDEIPTVVASYRIAWNRVDVKWMALTPGGGGGQFHIEGDGDVPLDKVWFLRSSILAQGI